MRQEKSEWDSCEVRAEVGGAPNEPFLEIGKLAGKVGRG